MGTVRDTEEMPQEIRLYKKRYGVVMMFVLLSASNAMQWIEYSIIAHIIMKFYSVSSMMVDWTSMIYMLSYVAFVLPASWILNKYGLRKTVMLGAAGNCLGAWVKIFSTKPDRFWVTFAGQAIVGTSQMFILGIPPHLAAVWFGEEQVSTACAAGVFGNQLGVALGFALPPLIVKDYNRTTGAVEREAIADDMHTLFLSSAISNTIILVLIVLFFANRPALPPSLAQLRSLEHAVDKNYLKSLRHLAGNINYWILLISYGINVGVFYAVSTLLNQMVLKYHEDEQERVGTIGLLIVVSGMAGAITCGCILDRSHHYKWATVIVYLFSFVGMLSFTFVIEVHIFAIFAVACLLGFFMTGYLPVGFEFAVELTYPVAEGTASGLLNASAQIFGLLLTMGAGYVITNVNIRTCNLVLSGFLLFGLVLTVLIKSDLRRQKAHRNAADAIPFSETQTTQATNFATD